MDILSLPDVFLRQLMRTMEIKDRLTLRITCRAFEKVVAETHAGYFPTGSLRSCFEDSKEKIYISFGEGHFTGENWTEDGREQFIHLLQRLFSGITFGDFGFKLTAHTIPMDFTLGIVQNFNIEQLRFHVTCDHGDHSKCDLQFKNAAQLIAHFPQSKYGAHLFHLPEDEKLLSLPPMEKIDIINRRQISAELFFQLIDKHKTIHWFYESVAMNREEFKKAIKIISADTRERTVRFILKASTIANWFATFGITDSTEVGASCGEFELIDKRREGENDYDELHLRYRRSTITFFRFTWSNLELNNLVSISNCQ